MDDVLVATLCTGPLECLLEYEGITAAIWMEMPEDMINVVPLHKRALATVLDARVRALLGHKRVLVQLNRAGVFALSITYIGVRAAAEHVQVLLKEEYARLYCHQNVDLVRLGSVLECYHDKCPTLDDMHMLPTTHDGSLAELGFHLDGDRVQLVLLTHPEVVIATFGEDDGHDLAAETFYEIFVLPVPDSETLLLLHTAPTASRRCCFNGFTGYAFPNRDAAEAAKKVLTRFGYFVTEPNSTFK